MGGGKKTYERASETGQEASEMSAAIAKDLYKQTGPYRKGLLSDWQTMRTGGAPTLFSSQFNTLRKPIEAQYGVAKENILANTPQGGGLFESLSDVETARAESLADIAANLYMDMYNKAYGAAYGAPQTSVAGLSGSMQYGSAGMQAAEQQAGHWEACCFNFLEAEGEIYPTVRRYRDEHFSRTGFVSWGYRLSARMFVPLMIEYGWFKTLIRNVMTRPLKYYSKWYYGQDSIGFIFWPVAKFWVNFWRLLGFLRRR